jgi:hypothetical protein
MLEDGSCRVECACLLQFIAKLLGSALLLVLGEGILHDFLYLQGHTVSL